jgi:hypothetical protein
MTTQPQHVVTRHTRRAAGRHETSRLSTQKRLDMRESKSITVSRTRTGISSESPVGVQPPKVFISAALTKTLGSNVSNVIVVLSACVVEAWLLALVTRWPRQGRVAKSLRPLAVPVVALALLVDSSVMGWLGGTVFILGAICDGVHRAQNPPSPLDVTLTGIRRSYRYRGRHRPAKTGGSS